MQEEQPFLFVGLGNPGPEYQLTRHNLGALVVEEFAHRMGWSLKDDRRFIAKVAKGVSENQTVHLVLPMTYMNLSGKAVKPYADYYKVPLNRIVVVSDDIAIAFGQHRLRTMGSAGGHNGLKSIEHSLGSSNYLRLRMGIGHPGEAMLVNYVLEAFNEDERKQLPAVIDRGVHVLQLLLKESVDNVMKAINTVPHQPPKPRTDSDTKDLTKPPLQGRGE